DAGEVTYPVAVGVGEAARVDLVDHGVGGPGFAYRHAVTLAAATSCSKVAASTDSTRPVCTRSRARGVPARRRGAGEIAGVEVNHGRSRRGRPWVGPAAGPMVDPMIRQPAALTRQPAALTRQPAVLTRQPAVLTRQPAARPAGRRAPGRPERGRPRWRPAPPTPARTGTPRGWRPGPRSDPAARSPRPRLSPGPVGARWSAAGR